MKNKTALLLFTSMISLCCASVAAAEKREPLVTDRPDFTEATQTVGKGVVQVELGYTYTKNDDSSESVKEHSIGEPLVRIGLTDWAELRIGWNLLSQNVKDRKSDSTASVIGGEDIILGLKFMLVEQDNFLPAISLISDITIPVGKDEFSNDKVTAGVNVLYAWELTNSISLAGNSGMHTAEEQNDDFTAFHQSVSIGIGLNDAWGMYVEYVGIFSLNRVQNTPGNFINGGFTFLITPDHQMDVFAGFGINDDANDVFVGSGFSFRL